MRSLAEQEILSLLKKVSAQLEEISKAQAKTREDMTVFYQEMMSLHQKSIRDLEEQFQPRFDISSMLN